MLSKLLLGIEIEDVRLAAGVTLNRRMLSIGSHQECPIENGYAVPKAAAGYSVAGENLGDLSPRTFIYGTIYIGGACKLNIQGR